MDKLILRAEFEMFIPKVKKMKKSRVVTSRYIFAYKNLNTNQNSKAKVVFYGKFIVLSESAIIFDSYEAIF